MKLTFAFYCACLLLLLPAAEGRGKHSLHITSLYPKKLYGFILFAWSCNWLSEFNGYPNVAVGKMATQRSVRASSFGQYAVDGDEETSAKTVRNSYPQWWYVDLGDDYMIDAIDIHLPDPAEGEHWGQGQTWPLKLPYIIKLWLNFRKKCEGGKLFPSARYQLFHNAAVVTSWCSAISSSSAANSSNQSNL